MQKPTGLLLVTIFLVMAGVSWVLGGLAVLMIPLPAIPVLTELLVRQQIIVGIVLVLIGALQVAVGLGVWSLRRWAQIVAMVWFGLGTASCLSSGIGLMAGITVYGMRIGPFVGPGIGFLLLAALYGFLIYYLSKPDISQLFLAGAIDDGSTTFFDEREFSVPPIQMDAPPPPPAPRTTDVAPSRPMPTQVRGAPPRPSGWLVVRNSSRAGKSFGLSSGSITTVGRDPRRADILLESSTVSGEHARVRCEGHQFYLYDLASTNGTFINNRQIQKQMLRDGDVIRFGDVEAIFKSVA